MATKPPVMRPEPQVKTTAGLLRTSVGVLIAAANRVVSVVDAAGGAVQGLDV